jgi:hypothetical protein
MSGHRWSGWPGAWCLDCGCECNLESAICCPDCYVPSCPEEEAKDSVTRLCPEHLSTQEATDCTEPGSKRHDPYAQEKRA